MTIQYTLVRNEEGEETITVYRSGYKPLVAASANPSFEEIKQKVLADDESAYDLFDLASAVENKFQALTERVSVRGGQMFLDGEPVHEVLATQVTEFIREGVEDWKPLVAFYENLQANPNQHSREQLFTWLARARFTITEDGMIVGYKGVREYETAYEVKQGDETITVEPGENGKVYTSTTAGHAISDGVEYFSTHIPQVLGSVVEMPRGEVTHDPRQACSAGLHVANFDYARPYSYGGKIALEVHVNPRDVVSVPTDDGFQKMRVCRYRVVQEVTSEYEKPVIPNYYATVQKGDSQAILDANGNGSDPVEQPQVANPKRTKAQKVKDAVKKATGRKQVTVARDNVFEDTDKRRAGNYFLVKKVENGQAYGFSLATGKEDTRAVERLASRKYRKLTRDEGRAVVKVARESGILK